MFKAVSADTNSIATSQTTSGAADLSLTSSSVNDGSNMASTVTIKSLTGNNSSITFNVTGTDSNGDAQEELAITGPGSSATVTTTAAFLTVTAVRANAAIPGTVEVGFTATTTTKGVLFGGATRVRGMHGVSNASTAGSMVIRNESQSGEKRLELDAPASAGMLDPYIPDEGIRYPNGAFIDISSGFDSITVFFDGNYNS
jgi:hypothetical protein